MLFPHFFCGQLRNARLAAEEVQRLSRLGQHAEQPVCKVHARDLLLQRRFAQLCREDDARTVRQDEIRPVQQRAELRVVQRLIADLGVRRDDDRRARRLKQLLCPRHRLVHRDIVKLQPQHILFHLRIPRQFRMSLSYHTRVDLSMFSRKNPPCSVPVSHFPRPA